MNDRCQFCGLQGPTRTIYFLQNVGLLVARQSRTAKGEACSACVHSIFLRYTGVTLVAGWWGMISFCVTPFFLLNNIGRYVGLLATSGPHKARVAARKAEVAAARRAESERAVAGDVGAGLELVKALLQDRESAEARSLAEKLLPGHPDRHELHYYIGVAKGQQKDHEGASESYASALELKPDEVAYRMALAASLEQGGHLEESESILRDVIALKPDDARAVFFLARVLGGLKRWSDALVQLGRYLKLAPQSRFEPNVAALAAALNKRRVPPPLLDDAELIRRATRSSRLKVAAAGLGVVAILAAFGVADNHVTVVVDNPSSQPIRVRADGEEWASVAPHSHQLRTLTRGAHHLEAIAGTGSGSTETHDVVVEAGLGAPLFRSATYVFDPTRTGVYVYYEVGYGSSHPTLEPEYHAAESWFYVPHLHDTFTEPPRSVQVSSGGGETRLVLKRATDVKPIYVAGFLLQHGRNADAVHYIESVLDEPRVERRQLLGYLYAAARAEEYEAVERWIDSRRTNEVASLDYHRAYQDAARTSNRVAGVEKEYAELVAKNPKSAFHQYLYGRVALAEETSLAAFEEAMRLDERFAWAHLGAGYSLSRLGRIDESLARYKEFFELAGANADELSHRSFWTVLCVHARWRELDSAFDDFARSSADAALDVAEPRGMSLIARGASDEHWQTWRRSLPQDAGESGWLAVLDFLRTRTTGKTADLDRALWDLEAHKKVGANWARLQRAGVALAANDREKAGKLISEQLATAQTAAMGAPAAVLLGIELEWSGDREGAQKWYDRAAEVATEFSEHELCRYLLNRANVRALVADDRMRSPHELALSALARALRTEDEPERKALVATALGEAAWELSDAWFQIKAGFFDKPPVR